MIQKSMKEIQQLFFDLALLVDEQGEMLDYVNINVTYISQFGAVRKFCISNWN